MSAATSEVKFSDGTTGRVLNVGTRVRHREHPELTGRIKCWEYHESGMLSPIPYNVAWDDSSRAAEVLGWFFIYASDHGIEPEPPQ